MPKLSRTLLRVLVPAVVTAAVVAAVASADGSRTRVGAIHACRNLANGRLRVVGPDAKIGRAHV